MDTQQIREQLHQLIDSADDTSLLGLHETLLAQQGDRWEWWNDKEFTDYLDRVEKGVADGTIKTSSYEDVKARMDETIRKAREQRNAA